MKESITMMLLTVGLLTGSCQQQPMQLYVSPSGSDVNTGTVALPFATVHAALIKASELKADDAKKEVSINIGAGEYHTSEPIVIDSKLSGLSIIGDSSASVTFKGSKSLKLQWELWDEQIYVADVSLNLVFDGLIVNNQLQTLARYPNYDENGGQWQGHAADAISPERLASWQKPEGVIFHAMHRGRWGGMHYEIKGIDESGNAILEGGYQNNRPSPPHETYRMVENVLEELDSPGEWYLDKDDLKLYYWPGERLDLKTTQFEGVVLENFITIKGDEQNPVKDIAISGIKFEYSKRTILNDYEQLLRSDWSIFRGGAIFIEGAENCVIEQCEFTNLGGNVIMVSGYNRNVNIQTNHIHDCGASAISIVGEASAVRSPSFTYREFVSLEQMDTVRGPKSNTYPKDCKADGNLIYRVGRIEKQTAGVQIAMAMNITVSRNSIYDVPRAGINIGDGTWGGHVLEYNDVFNTVLETGDHGSFNSWGRDRFWHPNRQYMDSLTLANPDMPYWDAINTTIIRNNRFRCDHGWDIDLDDGSSNYHIYNNLCLNGGIKLREGFSRTVENNVTINNSIHPHVWFEQSEDVIKHNVLADTYQDVRLSGWGKELDFNLFPNEASMLKPQLYDRDMNSRYGDPVFKDPSNLNYTVTAESPALELGFNNFPMDQFGVVNPFYKSIAKTPEVPVIKDQTAIDDGQEVAWLRNKIKSVASAQEQSAYGLNAAEGVIIVSVWHGSSAAQGDGIKKGDVILTVEGEKVKDVVAFLTITKKFQNAGKINVVVMRNQQPHDLQVNIK
ncbi:MAG: PDZ domain-containing protein [Cyclobacteriaceae bacterium]